MVICWSVLIFQSLGSLWRKLLTKSSQESILIAYWLNHRIPGWRGPQGSSGPSLIFMASILTISISAESWNDAYPCFHLLKLGHGILPTVTQLAIFSYSWFLPFMLCWPYSNFIQTLYSSCFVWSERFVLAFFVVVFLWVGVFCCSWLWFYIFFPQVTDFLWINYWKHFVVL